MSAYTAEGQITAVKRGKPYEFLSHIQNLISRKGPSLDGEPIKEFQQFERWPSEQICMLLANDAYLNIFTECSKQMAKYIAPQYLRQARDSANLVNTSKKPEVFFERLLYLHQLMKALSNMERYVRFSGKKPSQHLQEIERDRGVIINAFLDRYYQDIQGKISALKTIRAKENNALKFKSTLEKYLLIMTNENKLRAEDLYHNLYELCK